MNSLLLLLCSRLYPLPIKHGRLHVSTATAWQVACIWYSTAIDCIHLLLLGSRLRMPSTSPLLTHFSASLTTTTLSIIHIILLCLLCLLLLLLSFFPFTSSTKVSYRYTPSCTHLCPECYALPVPLIMPPALLLSPKLDIKNNKDTAFD